MGPWAGQLVFVNWSKIEALFSSRLLGDNVSGKSYELSVVFLIAESLSHSFL